MSLFKFEGDIPGSKSLFNRALIAQSFYPGLQISGDSQCDDVKAMRGALQNFAKKEEIFCGEAGTVLRFMALRVSREPGEWKLKGSERLMERPHDELVYLLQQLGVRTYIMPDQIIIQSEGWKKPLVPIQVHREKSSQFASGLLLASWELPFALELDIKPGVSEGYFEMTRQQLTEMGFKFTQSGKSLQIPAQQKPNITRVSIEADMSSAFVMAAAGAIAGTAKLNNISPNSSQPDFKFIEILKSLKVPVRHEGNVFTAMKAKELSPIDFNLNSTPDLFPVLAVLCAFAKGDSILWGAAHLAFKESNRIEKTKELLNKVGVNVTKKSDGIIIHGTGIESVKANFEFDTDHDHRMAFAAALLKLKGADIKILHPEVVTKSFSEFWKVIGVKP